MKARDIDLGDVIEHNGQAGPVFEVRKRRDLAGVSTVTIGWAGPVWAHWARLNPDTEVQVLKRGDGRPVA